MFESNFEVGYQTGLYFLHLSSSCLLAVICGLTIFSTSIGLGVNRIRTLKLIHVRSRHILEYMCEVVKHLHGEELNDQVVHRTLFNAVEQGIIEFIKPLCKANPDFLRHLNSEGRNIFQFSIECRQEKVFSLIYGVRQRYLLTGSDYKGNDMLHIAAMLSPKTKLDQIPGAALQMQREKQWFKEVERIAVLPAVVGNLNNNEGMTPHAQFTKSHKKLMEEGEKWMKDTSTSCTVVGALIITMTFGAAFTVPGGNDAGTGFPIFFGDTLFMAFIASDAISLFSSTTSVLMFLGILTSRYAEDDFVKSLPTKMIIGLSTLLISIATMMVAFCSALFIILHEKTWIVIPITFLACVPVTLFVLMQFPLLFEIFISTYGGGIFDKKVKENWI